jgi:hypothetical protein
MQNNELLVRLRELHEELSAININLDSHEQVDEATVDALGQLVTDAGKLVDQAKMGIETEKLGSEHRGLLDEVTEFDTRHPSVRQFLTQMTDLLAMIAI